MGDFLNSKNFKKFQDNQVTCSPRCCPCLRRAPTLLLLSAARQLRSHESNHREQEGRTPDPPVDAPCVAVDKLLLLVGAHVTRHTSRHTSHVTRHTPPPRLIMTPQDCFDPGLAYSEMPQPLSGKLA
jgi:hypothetical protein